jgi:beta-galactosidase/beta-glucuronidase
MLLTGLESWEPEGYKYEAYAWYRLRYDAPPLPFGKKVFLAFESVNEEMWIWVNGTLVDSRRLVTVENGKPLFVDVTGLLKRNTPNLLVVRRHTGLEPGGGWRSVKLFREK